MMAKSKAAVKEKEGDAAEKSDARGAEEDHAPEEEKGDDFESGSSKSKFLG